MRILFISNGYPPLQTAGTENYTAGIASSLARAGHQVSVVCAGEWDSGPAAFNGARREALDGVVVTRLDLNWTQGPDPNRFLFDNPLTELQVGQVLEQFRPDIVHITSCNTLSAGVIRAVKTRRLPLVVTLTDFWFFCPQVTLLRSDGRLCDGQTTAWECLRCMLGPAKAYRWPARVLPESVLAAGLTLASKTPFVSRRPGLRGMALDMAARKKVLPALLDLADIIIAPSQFLADISAGCGLRRDMRVVRYGLDLGWVDQLPERAPLGRLRLGYIGRMTPIKGVHILLQALAQLKTDESPEVHLFGDLEQEPAYAQELQRLAAGMPHVYFHGRFGRERLAEVYSQLDALVVPSIWYENNPLVIQEAFAAGMPVLASRLGGMAEFVTHGINGLLFEPSDASALAAALTEIAEKPQRLQQLRQGIPAVRTTAQEVATLTSFYAELVCTQSNDMLPQRRAAPEPT